MKTLLTIAFTLISVSCTKDLNDKNSLLTSITWSIKKADSRASEQYRFLSDGKYFIETNETVINGKWKWINKDEIFIEEEGLTIKGQANKLDAPLKSYIKILELSDKGLKTLERFERDAWDSGFAREQNYTAQIL
jgi:hypothetical protein